MSSQNLEVDDHDHFVMQSTLSVLAIFTNFIAFVLFYFNKNKSVIANLMMIMSFCECVNYYIISLFLIYFSEVIQFLQIRQVYNYLTFNFNETHDHSIYTIPEDGFNLTSSFLIKLNYSTYTSFWTMSIMMNICYCMEIICMIRNPISESASRYKGYKIISVFVSIITFLITYSNSIINNDDKFNYVKSIELLWKTQDFNSILLLVFLFLGVLSLVYATNVICGQTQFYTKDRLFFLGRQYVYIIQYTGLWVLPAIWILRDYIQGNVESMTILLSIAGITLSINRIFELNNCIRIFLKSNVEPSNIKLSFDSNDNNNNIKELDEISSTQRKTVHLSIELLNRRRQTNIVSFSTMLSNTFLWEYMFYIIQAVLKIGTELTEVKAFKHIKKIHFKEKYYYLFNSTKINSKSDLKKCSEMNVQIEKATSKYGNRRCLFNFWKDNIFFIEHCPNIFRNIMKMDSITEQELKESFNFEKNIENICQLKISEGKSGSFFFFTHDNRFIIKTIQESEFNTALGEFLENYYSLVTQNSSTFLARIYGVYSLEIGFSSRITIILMENVAPISSSLVIRRYDLKGSLVNRSTGNVKMGVMAKTLKDQDFLDFKVTQPELINFEKKSINFIYETLKTDIDLLRDNKLMDYSFFITIAQNDGSFDPTKSLVNNRFYISKCEKYVYFIGIIDYLTLYNKFKQLENTYKSMMTSSKTKHLISAVNPVLYAERFFNFMMNAVFEVKI